MCFFTSIIKGFYFRQLVQEFSELLKQDRSPVNVASSNNATNRHTSNSSSISQHHHFPPVLDSSVQRSLLIFSLITHGFGTPAITAAVDVFYSYLNEMLKNYEENYPMFMATTSSKNGCSGSDID